MLQSESQSEIAMANKPVPLAQAAIEVQLAVDLIMLLEQQQLPPALILAALDIVQADFQRALVAVNPQS